MKVLLINPSQDRALASEAGDFTGKQENAYPPLGLLYLQAALENDQKHQVEIIDAAREGGLSQSLAGYNSFPEVVGLTALTPNFPGVVHTVQEVKNIWPEAVIIVGGPHASLYPLETVGLAGVNYAVSGEAENTLPEFIGQLTEGSDAVFPGVFKCGGPADQNVEYPLTDDLDQLPLPDRSRLKTIEYRGLAGETEIFTTMLTSRGCPYKCSFCSTPRQKVRLRNPASIIEEAAQCLDLGIEHIYFVDDMFPLKGERLAELCAGFSSMSKKISWSCRTAVPGVTEDNLRLMKTSGCKRIQVGVETGTSRGLEALSKPISLEQVKRAVESAHRVGLDTMAYFMIGLPTERSPEDVRQTIRFAVKLDPEYALFNILTLYPGSKMYQDAMSQGLVKGDVWKDFAKEPKSDFQPPIWDSYLARHTLQNLLDEAYRSFYWRPKSILRRLRRPGGLSGLWRKMIIGLKMLKRRP